MLEAGRGREASGRGAIEAVNRDTFVVLCDIVMPVIEDPGAADDPRPRLDTSVVLYTGAPGFSSAADALRLGAVDYLCKPTSMKHLCESVARAARTGRLARARRETLALAAREAPAVDDTAGLSGSLDRALDTLWMAFQPIVRRDGTVYGYEALMRTREPSLPHPGAVLDAAERLGRIGEVGRRTRKMTAAAIGAAAEGTAIFLNLHASDLADPQLRSADDPIASAATRFVLEVTERASLDQVENPSAAVAALRERGFRIAVDDLGAGYVG